jgi:hypothetical protein
MVAGFAWPAVEDSLLCQGFVPDFTRLDIPLRWTHGDGPERCESNGRELEWIGPRSVHFAAPCDFERRRYAVCTCGAWLWMSTLPIVAEGDAR